jgi:Trypsin-like peptidase domain
VGVPLADRVLEVIADLGEDAKPRYRFGSGFIVRARTVLTAAHVVAGAKRIMVRGPDKVARSASLDPRFVGGGDLPDLALVEIDDVAVDLPAFELAAVDRDIPTAQTIEGCHAVGYPWFGESPSPAAVRDTVHASGYIPVLAKLWGGLLSLQVRESPRPLPDGSVALGKSEWQGMSGAPVLTGEYLLGVVVEHAPREGSSAISVAPVTLLAFDPGHPRWGPGIGNAPEWWPRLGVTGPDELRRLPARTWPGPRVSPSSGRGRLPRLLVVEDQIMADLKRSLDSEFTVVPVETIDEWNRVRDSLDVDGALIDRHLRADIADSIGTTVIADYLRKYTEIPAAVMSVAPPPTTTHQTDLCAKYRLVEVVHKESGGKLNEAALIDVARALMDPGEKARRRRLRLWVDSDLYHVEEDEAFGREGTARLKSCERQAEKLRRRLKTAPIETVEQEVRAFHSAWGPQPTAATP